MAAPRFGRARQSGFLATPSATLVLLRLAITGGDLLAHAVADPHATAPRAPVRQRQALQLGGATSRGSTLPQPYTLSAWPAARLSFCLPPVLGLTGASMD